MELQSQLSLRSLDVVEGRPSGTGRPSLPPRGEGPTADGRAAAPAVGAFQSWLERGLGQGATTGGSSLADRIERRIEEQVLGRVRSVTTRPATEASAARSGTERGARSAEPKARERSVDDMEPRSADERREDDSADVVAQAGAGAQEPAPRTEPRGRGVEARGRALAATDPDQAEGAATATEFQAAAEVGPPALQTAAPGASVKTAAAAASAAPSALPVPTSIQAGAAASNPAAPAVAGVAERQPNRAQAAAAPPNQPQGPSAEDLARADSVMRQLRAKIALGARDAVLELRPSELGKISVHLRLDAGTLSATLRAERPETLAILEAHAPELRAWLAQDGVEVRELDLGLADAGFTFERPSQRDRTPNSQRSRATSVARPIEELAPTRAPQQRADTSSGVDLVA